MKPLTAPSQRKAREMAAAIKEAVEDLRDPVLWAAAVAREKDMRDELQEFADKY